jgi:CheY-like chemotaxis protein
VQVGQSLDRSQGGLGIGLTLVRKLVEMHGGSVAAESPGEGRGSTFIVRLPAAAEESPVVPPSGASPAAAAPLPGRRILVVDDNRDAADSLAMLLKLQGHEVRTDYTGPTGLDAAREFRPDVVLLDIGLPGMSGYEVAKHLRRDPAAGDLFLVALTGWGSDGDRKRAKESGFDAHLTKPVDLAALQNLIGEIKSKTPRG